MSEPPRLSELKIKIFADGADLDGIREIAANPLIKGFTTNPTLMRKAGVEDYRAFALAALDIVSGRPISFEVFADEFDEMEDQAMELASWGGNVNVKIPVTNTRGDSAAPLVGRLSKRGVTVNITAVFTIEQVGEILAALDPAAAAIMSVFAGRIADSGRDPASHMRRVVEMSKSRPRCEVLWASPRELYNIFQADQAGCHIITVGNDHLGKLSSIGKNLKKFSRDTVKMFHDDAQAAGYGIKSGPGRLA